MPRQNRVTPRAELIAVSERGMFWGNRGCLLDRDGNLVRFSRGKTWAICLLEFKGLRRQLWAPGRLTELFFCDEATGLAAGHRPCGECRARDYRAFKTAYEAAHPGRPVTAPSIDDHLHADRLTEAKTKRVYWASPNRLPDGTLVDIDEQPWLKLGAHLLAWTAGGYGERRSVASIGQNEVTVLTPRVTVAVLAAGYRPVIHPSAAHR